MTAVAAPAARRGAWRWPRLTTALASPLLFLLLWWGTATSGLFPPQILVSPADVAAAFAELWRSGELAAHLSASFQRLSMGFGVGLVLGLAYGCAVVLVPAIEDFTGPSFTVLRGIPSIAFIPALILLFGIGDTFKVIVIAKASFFPIALATIEGVRGISGRLIDVARVLRLPKPVYVRHVLVPAALPALITGVRLALARSWGVLVAAELIASEIGLGQMMEIGRQMFRLDVVMAGVVIAGLVGFALDRGLRSVEQRLSRWREA